MSREKFTNLSIFLGQSTQVSQIIYHYYTMLYVKLHLIFLVISIQLNAILNCQLPYFPIEISRTAECSECNKWLFFIGSILLGFTMFYTGQFKIKYFTMWVGLVLLSWFDDKEYLLLHLFGVFIMFVGLYISINGSSTPKEDLKLILFAIIIYLIRIVLKVIVVFLFEIDTYSIRDIIEKIILIMYYGGSVCESPFLTIMVFRVCGVLQWIVFIMVATVLRYQNLLVIN